MPFAWERPINLISYAEQRVNHRSNFWEIISLASQLMVVPEYEDLMLLLTS